MNKKKKDFFQELRDRNVWREIKALLYHEWWGKIEKEKEKINIALNTWKNADKDYVLANKAKESAQEWNIEILN